MHRASISLQLLLWATGINALSQNQGLEAHSTAEKLVSRSPTPQLGFVTFKLFQRAPSSKQSLTDKVSKASQNLAAKYGSKESTQSIPEDPSLHYRNNNYNVATAVKPTVSNAIGIDQDGTDFSYFVEAGFGSDNKPMYMLVDTGASTTWVMGSGCTSDACTKHNKFGPNDSKTYKDTGESYSVEYGSGEVSGHVVSDSISIGGLEVTMPFGVANVTSNQFSQFPFEGILGLSMTPGTWLTYVKDAKLIDANVFGVALSRSADGTNDGEIAFGAPNKAKYKGDISYTTIKSGNSWAIPMDDVKYGDQSVGVEGRLAYIDTGTTFAFGPPDDVEAFYKLIPGSSSTDGQSYSIPCDSDALVSFVFSGKTWSASAKDFKTGPNGDGVCFGNVYGMEFVPGAWLLGDMFLKNVYSVFDADQKRIGFAARAVSSTGSSTKSAQGTSTTSPTGASTTLGTAISTATAANPGVGLVPNEPGSSTDTAAGSTPTTESAGGRLEGGVIYASLVCILSAIAMVV
ncbi:hypothetical protein AAE478_005421 [Parahypoxylon ruwenzoriense]